MATETPDIIRYDTNEWSIVQGAETIGTLERERPTRYAAGARHGIVADTSKEWTWELVIFGADHNHRHVSIEAKNFREAKREALAIVGAL